jgi:hypothetical protein
MVKDKITINGLEAEVYMPKDKPSFHISTYLSNEWEIFYFNNEDEDFIRFVHIKDHNDGSITRSNKGVINVSEYKNIGEDELISLVYDINLEEGVIRKAIDSLIEIGSSRDEVLGVIGLVGLVGLVEQYDRGHSNTTIIGFTPEDKLSIIKEVVYMGPVSLEKGDKIRVYYDSELVVSIDSKENEETFFANKIEKLINNDVVNDEVVKVYVNRGR